jgi:hypothetical protein
MRMIFCVMIQIAPAQISTNAVGKQNRASHTSVQAATFQNGIKNGCFAMIGGATMTTGTLVVIQ